MFGKLGLLLSYDFFWKCYMIKCVYICIINVNEINILFKYEL